MSEYGEAKIEIVLSTQGYMASIAILADLTYDLLAIRFDDENIKINKTLQFQCLQESLKQFESDLEEFIKLC